MTSTTDAFSTSDPDSASALETVTSVEVTLPSSSFFTTDSVPVTVSCVMVWEPSGLVTVVVVEPSGFFSTSVLSDGVGGVTGGT